MSLLGKASVVNCYQCLCHDSTYAHGHARLEARDSDVNLFSVIFAHLCRQTHEHFQNISLHRLSPVSFRTWDDLHPCRTQRLLFSLPQLLCLGAGRPGRLCQEGQDLSSADTQVREVPGATKKSWWCRGCWPHHTPWVLSLPNEPLRAPELRDLVLEGLHVPHNPQTHSTS